MAWVYVYHFGPIIYISMFSLVTCHHIVGSSGPFEPLYCLLLQGSVAADL